MPFEIYSERLIANNLPYDVRPSESHHAIITDTEGGSALKVSMRDDGEGGVLVVAEERPDEDGVVTVNTHDLIEAVAALRQLAGLKPDPLNPYLSHDEKEAAAASVVRACEALRTHPAHGCDELADDLQSQMLKVIDLASNRDFATIATTFPPAPVPAKVD